MDQNINFQEIDVVVLAVRLHMKRATFEKTEIRSI
jgi:hypothetical protein